MKKLTYLFCLLVITMELSCEHQHNYTRNEVENMLRSKSPDSIMDACEYIIQTKDTSFYEILLENPYRSGVSHNLRHYGGSAYKYQMRAMEILSGRKSPEKITSKPDSSIVHFYRKLVLKK